MKYKLLFICLTIVSALLLIIGIWRYTQLNRTRPVRNFEDCVMAGHPIQESYPEVCQVPGGPSFVNEAQRAKIEAPVEDAGINLTFATIVSGDSRSQTKAGRVAITDQTTWVKFWNDIHAHIKPVPPLIEVDFTKEMVVAVDMGPQPSGGYAIKVAAALEKPNVIQVKIQENKPGKGCVTTAALSNPYHIVKLAKSTKAIQFSSEKLAKDCS